MTLAFLCLAAIMVGINSFVIYDVNRFLSDHDSITQASLPAFKGVARRNMIMAVVSIPLGVAFIGLGIYMVLVRGLEGLVLTLGASTVLVTVGLAGRRREKRSQGLPCEPELNGEYQKICITWKKSILPDF
jgi:hypothetical protein